MKTIFIFLIIFIFSSFTLLPKDKDTLKEKASFVLDAYINYLNGIGDISYEFAEREQDFTTKFLELFASTTDISTCYNDLDPENKTSETFNARTYANLALVWYNGNTGLSSKFVGSYSFGKPRVLNGLNYIPVYVTKEVRGNYMGRKFHNKQYKLEFRIIYKISNNTISNVKIGSIELNNNPEPNYKEEEKTVVVKKQHEVAVTKKEDVKQSVEKKKAKFENTGTYNTLGNLGINKPKPVFFRKYHSKLTLGFDMAKFSSKGLSKGVGCGGYLSYGTFLSNYFFFDLYSGYLSFQRRELEDNISEKVKMIPIGIGLKFVNKANALRIGVDVGGSLIRSKIDTMGESSTSNTFNFGITPVLQVYIFEARYQHLFNNYNFFSLGIRANIW